jgi:hypothetical protein
VAVVLAALDLRVRLVVVAMLALCCCATFPALAGARAVAAGELALRFQPHLLFDSAERWRPVDVDAFLLEPGHQVCPQAPAPCAALTSLAQLTPAARYIDLRGTLRGGGDASAPDLATCARSRPTLLDCDGAGRSLIYAHVRRSGRRIAIDYWWFLRYDTFLHEGDWEGVTVVVDAAGARVEEVHFAAHADVWRYARNVPTIDARRHVRVYLANGTHAAYPKPCRRALCGQTQSVFPEARFDGRSAWVGNDAAACAGGCVRLLPESNGAPATWDAWNGLWGASNSGLLANLLKPPRTPAFQSRYSRPFAARTSRRHSF